MPVETKSQEVRDQFGRLESERTITLESEMMEMVAKEVIDGKYTSLDSCATALLTKGLDSYVTARIALDRSRARTEYGKFRSEHLKLVKAISKRITTPEYQKWYNAEEDKYMLRINQ